ncbi:hypothetical protein HanXRQr2_Chr07g0315001 [Helianthus annuus]|uniref:Uncharacterized protein n=1 Tax=Helianthus annuus TaxID=4232 RepID=A0A9K3NHF2_HELAN|nr:hypothetical protein HanXRQr2_Chr07g0315001 [Helianthus annuus]
MVYDVMGWVGWNAHWGKSIIYLVKTRPNSYMQITNLKNTKNQTTKWGRRYES